MRLDRKAQIQEIIMNTEQRLSTIIKTYVQIKSIQVDDFVINYAVAGHGSNLLLLHGLNIGWGQWYPNIVELSEHFRVYALDLPGAGNSTDIDPRTADLEKYFVDVVDKFIQIKNLKDVNVIGHSLGAWITLKLAIKKPSLINRMILVSPVGFSKYTPINCKLIGIYSLANLLSRTAMKPTKKNIKKFLESVSCNPSGITEEFIDYYYESIKISFFKHPFFWLNRLAGFLQVRKEFVLLDNMSKIIQPTLIIAGEKDPIIPFNKWHTRAFRLIPKVQVKSFKNTGHTPMIEKSTEFNQLAIEFLK